MKVKDKRKKRQYFVQQPTANSYNLVKSRIFANMDLQGSRIIKRYTQVGESKTLFLGKLLVLNTIMRWLIQINGLNLPSLRSFPQQTKQGIPNNQHLCLFFARIPYRKLHKKYIIFCNGAREHPLPSF